MNNLLIPAEILVNIVLWHGEFDVIKLIIGSIIIISTSLIDIWKSRNQKC